MSFGGDDQNPYAAPTASADVGAQRGFAISDEVRKLIATTATLMIVAGLVQLASGAISLVNEGFSASGLLTVALFGVVPLFTAIAGFSLRAVGKPGDDLGSLLTGFRSLHVAFLVKGVGLLLVLGFILLGLASMFLGIGIDFFKMWD